MLYLCRYQKINIFVFGAIFGNYLIRIIDYKQNQKFGVDLS